LSEKVCPFLVDYVSTYSYFRNLEGALLDSSTPYLESLSGVLRLSRLLGCVAVDQNII
jgi:hypothetical protein